MKQLKQLGLSLLSLSITVPVLIVAPAMAQHGNDAVNTPTTDSSVTSTSASGGTNDSSNSVSDSKVQSSTSSDKRTSGSSTTSVHRSTANSPRTETEVKSEHQTENEAELESANNSTAHQRGKEMIATLQKEQHQTRTDDQRKQACVARKGNLEKRVTNMSARSKALQSKVDSLLAKAISYQQAQNVTTNDVTSLVTAAQTAQTTSAASVASVQSVEPTLDCTKVTAATDVATYKAAADAAKTNLKSYKTAVRTLLTALKTASPATTKSGAQS